MILSLCACCFVRLKMMTRFVKVRVTSASRWASFIAAAPVEAKYLLGEGPRGGANLIRGETGGLAHGELREVLHPARECRAEEQRLSSFRAVPHDLSEFLEETHLEQAVRLVEHQRGEILQTHAVRVAHVVDHPPGSRDDDLGARAKARGNARSR